ncbi:MAG: hypothetical protein IKO67_04950, partial [Bacteroidaceae bacterium]|nr:hypothetical protein [Bacteroidaceae bacterium]
KGYREPKQHGRAVSKEPGGSLGAGAKSVGESEATMPQVSLKGSFAVGEAGAKLARAFEREATMPQVSRKGSFAVGKAGAKLPRAFESEAAIPALNY